MTSDDRSARSSWAGSRGVGQVLPAAVLDGRGPFAERPPGNAATGVPDGLSYEDLLQAAYSCGWADGCFAAPLEPAAGRDDLPTPVSRGRTPADFARSLWGHRAGRPPAGLDLNAPLWYARGFAEALDMAARR
jgi:hypothetical protein